MTCFIMSVGSLCKIYEKLTKESHLLGKVNKRKNVSLNLLFSVDLSVLFLTSLSTSKNEKTNL